MNEFLKTYEIVIKTIAPVFVGNGKEIGKKEYVFLPENSIGIVNIEQLYMILKRKGKAQEFEHYMLNNNRDSLSYWLKEQGLDERDISSTFKYSLKSCDYIDRRQKGLQVKEFIKDPYGNPYIPGTSLKGMLRTILLSKDIMENKGKYNHISKGIEDELKTNDVHKISKKKLLRKKNDEMEGLAYRTIGREKTRPDDAVNDVLQGFIVSDSESLSVKDLVLCQKIEVHKDRTEKALPILRESIKPGVLIKFKLTIDHSLCNYNDKDILIGIRLFAEQYFNNFLVKFDENKLKDNVVYLGGGCGFLTKTMIYPMFNDKGVGITKTILDITAIGKKNKNDISLGVSPHILKCTHYDGQLYQFGQCELMINEV